MEAKPEGSPGRVGHGIASPQGAAKKEVHTSITGSLDEPSCTANREVQPHPSPTIQYSEWLPTQGQLSCLSCQIMRGRVANCKCLAPRFSSPTAPVHRRPHAEHPDHPSPHPPHTEQSNNAATMQANTDHQQHRQQNNHFLLPRNTASIKQVNTKQHRHSPKPRNKTNPLTVDCQPLTDP